ncbi:hypothetical protein Tco_1069640 [Tanacetum coccineum]|uniref:Uncharacterized protein n=1 Tax=Tanacetum coccineum TaxID=301880 RepID=A0ABQ5HLD4_9ASTR
MHRTMRKSGNGTNIMHHLPMYPRRGKKSLTVPRQRRPNNSVTMTYKESRAKLKQQIVDTETSSSSNESRYDVQGTVGAGLRRARKLGQVATTCEEPSGQTLCEEPSGTFYVVRGTCQVAYECEEPSGQVLRRARKLGHVAYDVLEEPWAQSLRRAGKTSGRFTTLRETQEKTWSSRYDVRGTVGAGLRRARKLGQVATTCEERSGQVYDMRVTLVKSLRRARNRRGTFTSCEETWSSRYDVRGNVVAGLRRARKLGQVATTCEEPSGHVYVVRGNLVKSLRRARKRRGRFTTCEETWSSRYDVRGTVRARLRHARKLGQVATTCEETSGQVYDVRENLVKSLRRARNRRGTFTSCEETWSSRYDVRGNRSGRFYNVREKLVAMTDARNRREGLRRARELGHVAHDVLRGTVGQSFTSCEETLSSATLCEEPPGLGLRTLSGVTLVKSLDVAEDPLVVLHGLRNDEEPRIR